MRFRCEILDFLKPAKVNCLAFIPSLAASFGLACGGGLIRANVYVLVGGLS